VGLGSQGLSNLAYFRDECRLVALCDVDLRPTGRALVEIEGTRHDIVTGASLLYPDATLYQDFRKMLIEKGDQIDAVGIATHDRTHFAVAWMAMEMGKHVFVQKPLAHSLAEVRAPRKKAAEKKLVTQMGNQGHASEGIRLIREWYEADLIGEITEVLAWTNRPGTGSGFRSANRKSYPVVEPVPKGLDWDLWLGPVEESVGYSPDLHPGAWRAWWEFGGGGLGDIGCHTLDASFWLSVSPHPPGWRPRWRRSIRSRLPAARWRHFIHFPARGGQPPVVVRLFEAPAKFPKPAIMSDVEPMIMLGSKGAIYAPGLSPDSPRLFPDSTWRINRENPEKRVPKTLPRVRNIFADWIDGLKNGTTPCSNFDYSARLTEVVLLGTLAIRTGKPIE
jgi:predicted dehydrogenase